MKKIISELKKEFEKRDIDIDDIELNEILESNEYVTELPIATRKSILLEELRVEGIKK